MKYDLILKGTVGWWDFNSGRVDDLLREKDGEEVHVLIDSLGGLLSEGLSISSAFASHGHVHVHLRGMNASAATVATMGARRVTMDRSAMYLVHKTSFPVLEWDSLNADALKAKAEEYMKRASDLEKMDCNIAMMYAGRCKKDVKDLAALMAEDKWLTSAEAVEWGFVDEITADGEPLRLGASTATAMADAGIPVPENIPVEADGFLARLERMLQRVFGKTGRGSEALPCFTQSDDVRDGSPSLPQSDSVRDGSPSLPQSDSVRDGSPSLPSGNNPQKTTIMKKAYSLIAAALGMEQAEMETNADGFFAFDEGQTDAIEQALADKDTALAARDKTIAELQSAVEEQKQAIAALQAKPEAEPDPVRAQGDNQPDDDPVSAFAGALAEARRMAEALG